MFQVTTISKPILAMLYELNGCSVHSIFTNVVNIKWTNKLVCIQNKSIPKGTLSIVINETINFKQCKVNPQDIIIVANDLITIGDLKLYIGKEIETWDPHIKKGMEINLLTNTNIIKNIRRLLLMNGTDSGLKSATLQSINNTYETQKNEYIDILKNSSMHIRNKDTYTASKTISELIGVGIGLTPSGDDFILGLLSVLYLTKEQSNTIKDLLKYLGIQIINKMNKTTDVSRSYLSEGIDGKFIENFHNIYSAISNNNMEALYKSVSAMVAVGHSSGTDGLCGILWGLYQLENLK